MSRYGSRKFIIAMMAMVGVHALAFLGAIGDTVYGATVGSVLLLYGAANVGHAAVLRGKREDEK